MSIQINRFEVINQAERGQPFPIGYSHYAQIKDHKTDKIIVEIGLYEETKKNKALAEKIISLIEEEIEG